MTNEWFDGIISKTVKQVVKEKQGTFTWDRNIVLADTGWPRRSDLDWKPEFSSGWKQDTLSIKWVAN